jgi:hypothetical protein
VCRTRRRHTGARREHGTQHPHRARTGTLRLRDVAAFVELQIAEQPGGSVRVGRVFRPADVAMRIEQGAVAEAGRVVALNEGGAAGLAEPRDLPAQRPTRVVRVRPQQRCGAPLQRPLLAIGSQQRRVARQADLRGRAVGWRGAMIARR